MPLPDDYINECLYGPEGWFVTDAAFFPEEKRIVGYVDTTRLGPLVEAQVVKANHPKHVPAGLSVHITGILGSLYAVYVLGLRSSEGWVGFGTHIHHVRFPKVGQIGPVMACHLECLSDRTMMGTRFTKFRFRYEQDGEVVYESEQTAAWIRPNPESSAPLE